MHNVDNHVIHTAAGKLNITINTKTADTLQTVTAAKLEVSMGVFTSTGAAVGVVAANLISSDKPNDLRLGADSKLLSQPPDIDFLSSYILSSN